MEKPGIFYIFSKYSLSSNMLCFTRYVTTGCKTNKMSLYSLRLAASCLEMVNYLAELTIFFPFEQLVHVFSNQIKMFHHFGCKYFQVLVKCYLFRTPFSKHLIKEVFELLKKKQVKKKQQTKFAAFYLFLPFFFHNFEKGFMEDNKIKVPRSQVGLFFFKDIKEQAVVADISNSFIHGMILNGLFGYKYKLLSHNSYVYGRFKTKIRH